MRKFQPVRTFPKGSIIIRPKTAPDVVIGISEDSNGRVYAIAYSGKRNRPDFNYSYKSVESRDRSIAEYLRSKQSAVAAKAERKSTRVLTENPVKVGDIFYSSWGYDQTNVDFYEVLTVKGCYASVRQIASNLVSNGGLHDSGKVTAAAGQFIEREPVMRKKIQTHDNGKSVYFTIASYANAYPWDGQPKHCSWSH